MRVLLVYMRRECEGDGNARVGDEGRVVVVSAWHVGGTRGSGIVSNAADVPGMSVVRGMRGVGGSVLNVYALGLGRLGEECG